MTAAAVNLYVSPVEGVPHWWIATNHDGLSFSGSFPWALRDAPEDEARHAGYQVAFEPQPAFWREATRDESVVLVWDNAVSGY